LFQERHWFEWVTRQARRSTEFSLIVIFGMFLSAVFSWLIEDKLHQTITHSFFLVPLLLVVTGLTLINVRVNFQINSMDRVQVYRLQALQGAIRQETIMRSVRKQEQNNYHACDFYLQPVFYCSFCSYVEFLGCKKHKTLFSLCK